MSYPDTHQPEHIFEYDVAFSFAEENWRFVDRVAGYLKQKQVKVYYYKDREHDADAWGQDLFHHLQAIYRDKARFCVMFISQSYKDKHWTTLEQEWAKERARKLIREKSEQKYILPFKFDDTEIEGLEKLRYLSIDQYNEKRLADIIEEKIRPKSGTARRPWQQAGRYLVRSIKPAALIVVTLGAAGWLTRMITTGEKQPVMQAMPLYKQSPDNVAGSVCEDSMITRGHGQGACSHHGGVARQIDSAEYEKLKETREEIQPLHRRR